MVKKIEKLIAEHEDKLNEWVDSINRHTNLLDSYLDFSTEEAVDITMDAVQVLAGLADISISYGNFKEQFEHKDFRPTFIGPELIINAEKTGTTYLLGMDSEGIYINTYLKWAENIPYMDDRFWNDLMGLQDFKGFELLQSEEVGHQIKAKYPRQFASSKSMLFRFFRKYFMDITQYDDLGSLGDLQVKWSFDHGIEDIITELATVFKVLYQLNYSLWKVGDLRAKK